MCRLGSNATRSAREFPLVSPGLPVVASGLSWDLSTSLTDLLVSIWGKVLAFPTVWRSAKDQRKGAGRGSVEPPESLLVSIYWKVIRSRILTTQIYPAGQPLTGLLGSFRLIGDLATQFQRNAPEFLQRRLQVLDDLGCEDVWCRKAVGVFETVILKP